MDKLDQYNRRNNIEIQGIPTNILDELSEDKIIHIFISLNIDAEKRDIEHCHIMGKAT